MIYVGIDWGRSTHHVSVLDPQGRELHRGAVAHNAAALAEPAQTLRGLEPDPAQVRVGVEQHDGALLHWLLAQGYALYPLNPKSAERARDRYRPAGGKDDRRDAFILADIVRTDGGALRRLEPPDQRGEELLSRLHERDHLVRAKTAQMQRLRALLAEWCPELSALCGDFEGRWQRRLLAAFPLQQDLVEADLEAIRAACGRKLHPSSQARLEALRAVPCLPVPTARRAALAWQVRRLVAEIGQLLDAIAEIETELRRLIDDHPQAELAASLAVQGVVSCATLLAIMSRGLPWRAAATAWGVAPITKQSGKQRQVRRRRGCDHFVSQVLLQFAFNTVQREGSWAAEMYRAKRDARCDHYTSLRAIARVWVKICCAMWRDNTRYDEALHRTRRQAAALTTT